MTESVVGTVNNPVTPSGGDGKVLLNAVSVATTGAATPHSGIYKTFQATNNGSGTTTVVDILVSNDGTQWITMGTINLSSNDETDGFASNASWKLVKADATTVTAGTVTVTMGG